MGFDEISWCHYWHITGINFPCRRNQMGIYRWSVTPCVRTMVSGIISKSFCSIYFKHNMCANWVSLHMSHIWGLRTSREKCFISFMSNLAIVLIRLVFRNYSIFRPWSNIWPHGGVKICESWCFRTNWKSVRLIQFKPCRCAYLVSLKIFWHFWPHGQLFVPPSPPPTTTTTCCQ